MKKNLLITATLVLFLSTSCGHRVSDAITITVYTDSIVSDVSKHPVGINLNFIMDGGRFPEAKKNVTEVVKELGTKYLRYPGGEKSDLYLFSIPPYEESHTSLARTIGLDDYPGVFKDGEFVYDPLDFDEFMKVCRDVGAEPVLVIAADNYLRKPEKGERVSGREALIKHAAEWVRYANIKKKYNVRYWMIGNESWNKNNENSTVDIYAQDVIDFSKAMKAVDPSILVIPNGDSDEFFKAVITKAGDYIDRLCVSNYGIFNFNAGYESYKDTSPFSLSGGQMRRVAIAGIIALSPKYLVLDEPTAGLDPKAKHDLLKNIKKLYDKKNITIIMVSHNMDDIMDLAERVVILNDGQIIADGMPKDIFMETDLLNKAGLRPPHLTQLLQRIKGEALTDISVDHLNAADAAEDIYKAWSRRGKDAQ